LCKGLLAPSGKYRAGVPTKLPLRPGSLSSEVAALLWFHLEESSVERLGVSGLRTSLIPQVPFEVRVTTKLVVQPARHEPSDESARWLARDR